MAAPSAVEHRPVTGMHSSTEGPEAASGRAMRVNTVSREAPSLHAVCRQKVGLLRIPTKPAGYSNLKPATYSDMKPARVPISFRPPFGSGVSRPDGCSWVVVDVRGDVVSGQVGMVWSSAERRLRKLSPANSMR